MKYFEFGTENPELMVMLHGGGTTYLGMLPTAKVMAKVCHVVLVAYDGFDPDEPETEFVSPMDEARRLGDYIVEHYHRQIREHTCFAEHYMLGIPCSAEIRPYRVKTLGHTTVCPAGLSLSGRISAPAKLRSTCRRTTMRCRRHRPKRAAASPIGTARKKRKRAAIISASSPGISRTPGCAASRRWITRSW